VRDVHPLRAAAIVVLAGIAVWAYAAEPAVPAIPIAAATCAALVALWRARDLAADRRRLREDAARYREFANIAADWFWETDADGVYTFRSDAAPLAADAAPRGAPRRARGSVLEEAGAAGDEVERQRRDFEARRPLCAQRPYVRRDGSPGTLRIDGRPVFRDDGTFAGYRGIARDVDADRGADERLRQSAAVFETLAEAVMVTDAQRCIQRINPAFTEVTGYTEDEVRGRHTNVLRSGVHDGAFYAEFERAIRDDGHWRGETWDRRKDGSLFPAWQCINAVRDADGEVTNFVIVMLDISELKEYQAQMEHLAHHDALTGLPNRTLCEARLEQALQRARRHDTRVAVLFLDLDDFKKVNDLYGHASGDGLLGEVAQRLTGRLRASDTVARIAGDEFLIVLDEVSDDAAAARVAAELATRVSEPCEIDGDELLVSVSIGVAVSPGDGTDTVTLTRNADAAMYRAKEQGRNRYCMYTRDITARVQRRLVVERRLRRALERDELGVHYQPQFDCATGGLVGAEALARWEDSALGTVPPDEFIRVAEDAGLVDTLDQWVMHTACDQLLRWRTAGLDVPVIAVNVSGRDIERGALTGSVQGLLALTGMEPGRLELELTETYLMQGNYAYEALRELREVGVRFAVDDFGTGYSSLSYLEQLPVDRLKIDRAFVARLDHDPTGHAIVEAIVAMAHSLGIEVMAEGVETQSQLDVLRGIACDAVQGYLLGRPMDPEQFLRTFGDREPEGGRAGS